MKKLFSLLFLIVTSLTMHSQVAGYMGKRFQAGYSLSAHPTMLFPSASSGEGEPGINLLHSIEIDYVTKPHTSFCLAFQYGKTGLSHAKSYYNGGTSIEYVSKGDK